MFTILRDSFLTCAAAKYLGVGKYLRELVVGVFFGFLLLLAIVLGLLFSAIPISISLFLLFGLGFGLALAYEKASWPCTIFIAGSGCFLLQYTGTFCYLTGIGLLIFSLCILPLRYHPPFRTKWIAWRFVFVFTYVLWSLIFFHPLMFNDFPTAKLLWCIFWVLGSIVLNHLFFYRFQWRYFQAYYNLVKKFGTVINNRDKELFSYKLSHRFNKSWDRSVLKFERDKETNSWEDRIMYSYLFDHLNK